MLPGNMGTRTGTGTGTGTGASFFETGCVDSSGVYTYIYFINYNIYEFVYFPTLNKKTEIFMI